MEAPLLNPGDLQTFIDKHGLQAQLIMLPVPTLTVDEAAAAVGALAEHIVKSLLFWIESEPIIVMASGPSHIDRRSLAAYFKVSRKKVTLLGADDVVEISGYPVGAVPPFGHRKKLRTLMDAGVLQAEEVYAGGGAQDHLMRVSPEEIFRVTEATVLDLRGSESIKEA